MPQLRRTVLLGWITLAIVGATTAIAGRQAAPAPTGIVAASSFSPTSTAAPAPTTTVAAPVTTTTSPPPATTVAPAPSTTVAPVAPVAPPTTAPRAPRAPTTTTAPAPAPAAAAAPAVSASPDYAQNLLGQVVPGSWLSAVPVHFEIIAGKTSWSSFGGLIEVGDWQLTSSVGRAKFTLAHEWGHQLAWKYGTDAYNGAGPAGFPYNGPIPEEQWADCVGQALTGTSYPSGGLHGCPSDSLAFTSQFLSAGPPGPALR
jgi:hypothetical protein